MEGIGPGAWTEEQGSQLGIAPGGLSPHPGALEPMTFRSSGKSRDVCQPTAGSWRKSRNKSERRILVNGAGFKTGCEDTLRMGPRQEGSQQADLGMGLRADGY